MALARIITRSHACSRELAVDLLARGYAVEIVSPDAVPDNIADLELRVDAGPGDQLIANVATHTGERSASLEFVHHLKAPMVDFMRRERRPLEAAHAVPIPDAPTNLNPQPEVGEVRQPAETQQLALKTVPTLAEIHPHPHFAASTSRIEPPQLPSLPRVEAPLYFEAEVPMTGPAKTEAMAAEPTVVESKIAESRIAASTITESAVARPAIARSTIRPALQSLLRGRSVGFFWPALTLAGVIALALVLAFGIRPAGKESARLLNEAAKDPGVTQALAASPPAAGNLDHAPKPSKPVSVGSSTAMITSTKPAIAKPATTAAADPMPANPKWANSRPATVSQKATGSGRGGNDIIARDTVTYLDKRYQQQAAKKPALKAKSTQPLARKRRTSRRNRDSVVAANKVTYLKRDAAPKAVQQESLNKRPSDLK
jgi:hypothetical protein